MILQDIDLIFIFRWLPWLSDDAFLGIDVGNKDTKDYQSYAKKLQRKSQYSSQQENPKIMKLRT